MKCGNNEQFSQNQKSKEKTQNINVSNNDL